MVNSKTTRVIALACLAIACPQSVADERSAADLLPETTVAYAQVSDLPSLLETIEKHPVKQRLLEIDEIRGGFETKQFLEFKAVVSIVEARLGQPWAKLVKQSASKGVAVAFDAKSEGLVILVQAADDQVLPKVIDSLKELVRADANSKGNPDPIKEASYRDIPVFQVNNAKVAAFGPWLAVTNKDDLGKAVLDQYLDDASDSFAHNSQFQQARRNSKAAVWAYVDWTSLRATGIAKGLYNQRSDNIVTEMLLGGVMDVMRNTPYLTASLDLNNESARLAVTAPSDAAWLTEAREHYFGPEGKGLAPELLAVDGQILALSTYRDFGQMWIQAGDLFDDNVNDELAQADSNLSNLFAGRDFGEDILGAVKPEVQFIVARQSFKPDQPRPQLKLPAFALSWKLKDPGEMRAELRRTFQSAIGFLNVVGAMNGQPQLDQDMEKDGDLQIVTASYLVDKNEQNSDKLPINFNFSPTVAFVGDRFVLSSTLPLARSIVASDKEPPSESLAVNTIVRSQLDSLASTLDDNREALIAQNMLEEGHTRDEAEQAIGTLLQLVNTIKEASLILGQPTEQLELALEVTFSESTSP